MSDGNTLIRDAVNVWRPGPRWVWRKEFRRAYAEIETRLAGDDALARLHRLESDLKGWNYLESSVAAALVASAIAAVPTVLQIF